MQSIVYHARMAESVDALVSNTNVRKDVPVRPRLRVLRKYLFYFSSNVPKLFPVDFLNTRLKQNIPANKRKYFSLRYFIVHANFANE